MKVSWSLVGTGIATFITGVAAAVGIIQWYNAPKGDLRASLIANEYETAPTIARRPGLKDTAVKQPSISITHPAPDTYVVAGEDPEAFLTGRVENEGSKEIKGVVLRIPDALYACLKREPDDWKCQGASSVIALGDLAPLESMVVQVWLRSKLSRAAYESMKLTHSEGVGSIDFDTVEIPFGFIRRNGLFVFFGVLVALLVLYGYLADRRERDFKRGVEWAKRQDDAYEKKRAEIAKEF